MKGSLSLTFLPLSFWGQKKNITKKFEVTFADLLSSTMGTIIPVLREVEKGGRVVRDQLQPFNKREASRCLQRLSQKSQRDKPQKLITGATGECSESLYPFST